MLPQNFLYNQVVTPTNRILTSCKARQRQREKGFWHVVIVAILAVVVTVGTVAWIMYKDRQNSRGSQSSQDSAPRTAPGGMPSLPNPSQELRIDPELQATPHSGNCENLEFAGVGLGMSYRQARAGLVRHFNLSSSEALEKIKPNFVGANFHPSIRDKENPTKAELDRAAQETPNAGFTYNCKIIGSLADCANSKPPHLSTISLPRKPPDLEHPDAVVEIRYLGRALKQEAFAKLGSPNPPRSGTACEDEGTCFRWRKRICSWRGSATATWGAELTQVDDGDYLRLSFEEDGGTEESAAAWFKAKGWTMEPGVKAKAWMMELESGGNDSDRYTKALRNHKKALEELAAANESGNQARIDKAKKEYAAAFKEFEAANEME
ncbi:MAG: hypothetical protein LBQ75_08055 [Zoogloeaceae bacterium]|nr:hypothetical protein [Zoogloeaceae bacterium]